MKKFILLFLFAVPLVFAYEFSYQGRVDKPDGSALDAIQNLTVEINDSNVMIYNETWVNGVTEIKEGLWGFDVVIGRNTALNTKYGKNYSFCVYISGQLQGGCYILQSGVGLVDSKHLNITQNLDMNDFNIIDTSSSSVYIQDNLTVEGYINILSGDLFYTDVYTLRANGTMYPYNNDAYDLGLNNTNMWRYGYFSRDLFGRNLFFNDGYFSNIYINNLLLDPSSYLRNGTDASFKEINVTDINLTDTLAYSSDTYISKEGGDLVFEDTNYGTSITLTQLAASSPGGVCLGGNRILSGGIVTYSGSGLTFDISLPLTYCIDGLQYSITQPEACFDGGSVTCQVTLEASDSALNRIDLIVANSSSNVTYKKGTAATQPSAPSLDVENELELTLVYIPQGAVNFTGNGTEGEIPRQIIYDEGVEWKPSQNTPVGELDFNSTTDPQANARHVESTTPLGNGDYFQFANSSFLDPSDYSTLSFYIKNQVAWATKKGGPSLLISFRNSLGSIPAGANQISLKDNTYGFDSQDTTNYQKIAITLGDFGALGTDITTLYMEMKQRNPGETIDIQLDSIILQGTPGDPGNITPSELRHDNLVGDTSYYTSNPDHDPRYPVKFSTSEDITGRWTYSNAENTPILIQPSSAPATDIDLFKILDSSSSPVLTVNNSGKVGIGTSEPGSDLTIGANKVNLSSTGDVNATKFYGTEVSIDGIKLLNVTANDYISPRPIFAVSMLGKTGEAMPHFWVQGGGDSQASGVSRSFMIVNEAVPLQNTTNISSCVSYMQWANETLKIDCNTTTTGADLLVGDDMQVVGDIWLKDTDDEWHFMTRELEIRDELMNNIVESKVNVSLVGDTITVRNTEGTVIVVNLNETNTFLSSDTDSTTITSGTNISPTFNHVYYDDYLNPTLTVSSTGQSDKADIAQVVFGGNYDYGSIGSSATNSDFIYGVYHRLFDDGSLYNSGFDPYVSSSQINITTGIMKTMIIECPINVNHSSDELFIFINDTQKFNQFTSIHNLSNYGDGSDISNNKFFTVVCGIVNTINQDGRMYCMVQNEPNVEHTKALDAELDNVNINYFPNHNLLKKLYVPVVQVVMKRTGTTNAIQSLSSGDFYYDLRGQNIGFGGNPPSPSITDHGELEGLTDNDHPIYLRNNTDANLTRLTVLNKVNLSSTGDVNATKFYGDGSSLNGIISLDGLWKQTNFTAVHTDNTIHNYFVESNLTNIITNLTAINNNLTQIWINISAINNSKGSGGGADGSKIANGTDANLTGLTVNGTVNLTGKFNLNTNGIGLFNGLNLFDSDGTRLMASLYERVGNTGTLIINGQDGISDISFGGDNVNYIIGTLSINSKSKSKTFNVEGTGNFTENVVFGDGINVTGDIHSTGNVGIGETHPSAKLDITVPANTQQTQLDISGYDNDNTFDVLKLTDENSNTDFVIRKVGGNTIANVGIGTALPRDLFTVQNVNTTNLTLINTGTGYEDGDIQNQIIMRGRYWSDVQLLDFSQTKIVSRKDGANSEGGSSLSFHTSKDLDTLERMRITAEGDVGIGTTAPNKQLHVVGDVNITSELIANMSIKSNLYQPASSGNIYFRANDAARYAVFEKSDGSDMAYFQMDAGHLYISGTLFHTGDTNTNLQYTPDQIILEAGGVDMITMTTDAAAEQLTFNEEGNDTDIRFESNLDLYALTIDGGTGNVGISTVQSSQKLHVSDGNLCVYGGDCDNLNYINNFGDTGDDVIAEGNVVAETGFVCGNRFVSMHYQGYADTDTGNEAATRYTTLDTEGKSYVCLDCRKPIDSTDSTCAADTNAWVFCEFKVVCT